VVSINIKDLDVFSIATDDQSAYVNYLKVVDGTIVHAHTIELTKNLNEDLEDLLRYAIPIVREQFQSVSREIVLPFKVRMIDDEIKVTIPQRGEKKHLLDLSLKNVDYFVRQKERETAERKRKQTSAERILTTLKDDLRMDKLPLHIECFDNSNMQGSHPVASCVVFKNAKPAKKDYRHFHIKTVVGANDFASMEEVVFRRYRRLLVEDEPLPQLIVIDGGKGQLNAALNSLDKLEITDKLTVIGIAKRLEEIYMPGDSIPLYINKKSESLKLIQQLRNEAHRFAITFHRNVRSKNFTTTELTDIKGIGDKTAEKLISHFGSVQRLKESPIEEVAQIVNPSIAKKIFVHFKLV
jgi:excinuclease ABC subunit C